MRAVHIVLMTMSLALGAPAAAEPVSPEQQAVLEKPWRGTWTGSGGYQYSGELTLEVGDEGEVEGEIAWTLRRSPFPEELSKVGQSAIERVRGTYSPSLGALTFQGYETVDQNALIGLDLYRLAVADDGSRILGVTSSNATWDGRAEFLPAP